MKDSRRARWSKKYSSSEVSFKNDDFSSNAEQKLPVCFFLSCVAKTQFHHGTRRVVDTRLRQYLKGGPEPLEKEINEILGSKREDRLSDPFFELIQNTTLVSLSYLLRLGNFCKFPRKMRKFPQKCQKIAWCWGRTIYVHNFQSFRHLPHPLQNDRV